MISHVLNNIHKYLKIFDYLFLNIVNQTKYNNCKLLKLHEKISFISNIQLTLKLKNSKKIKFYFCC